MPMKKESRLLKGLSSNTESLNIIKSKIFEKVLAKTISKMYNIVISTVVLNILDIKYVYNNNQEVNYGCT